MVTMPPVNGVKVYHTPFPKLPWHDGVGSPPEAALVVFRR
jgi:hypothetical protein